MNVLLAFVKKFRKLNSNFFIYYFSYLLLNTIKLDLKKRLNTSKISKIRYILVVKIYNTFNFYWTLYIMLENWIQGFLEDFLCNEKKKSISYKCYKFIRAR